MTDKLMIHFNNAGGYKDVCVSIESTKKEIENELKEATAKKGFTNPLHGPCVHQANAAHDCGHKEGFDYCTYYPWETQETIELLDVKATEPLWGG